MKSELKTCPFCGGEASITLYDPYDGYQGANCGYYVAYCSKCSVQMSNRNKEKLIKEWNRRANDEQAD